jgi:hypothetical protein
MKKICLTVIGLYILLLHAFAQTNDSSIYKPKPLRIDEVNLVSSYYSQNGDHSPVTGGIGTEKVTDISNGIELKFVGWDKTQHKHTLTAGLGVDYHSSASAAFVNKTGASKTGGSRIYPSLDWTVENEAKGNSFGLGTYYSAEYNYHSFGADVHFSQKTNDRNGEFSAKAQAYFDQVTLIYPSEFIPPPVTTVTPSGTIIITTASGRTTVLSSGGTSTTTKEGKNLPTSPRNTFTGSLSYSQIINTRLQIMFLLDAVAQNGYLGLPFHRVYFSNGKDTIENLPSSRFKLPVGVRLNYFLGDNIVLRSYYRYYTDDWGLTSNTASVEVPVKFTPFFSVSPFYRYYQQTAAKYFAPYEVHKSTEQYYTSNYSLSQFQSNFFGVGFRFSPPKGVFGWQSLNSMEIRYGHYTQTTDLVSDVISVNFSLK